VTIDQFVTALPGSLAPGRYQDFTQVTVAP
jgi:hypothetical protein